MKLRLVISVAAVYIANLGKVRPSSATIERR